MKKVQLFLLLLMSSLSGIAMNITADTTIVEFTDKGVKKRVTILSSGNQDLNLPKVLSLENVLKNAGVDSLERKKAIILAGEGGKQDTILVLARDGRNIKIVARAPKDFSISRDTLRRERTPENEDHWSKENEQPQRDVYQYDNHSNDNDSEPAPKATPSRFFPRRDFGIYLGLNNWNNGTTAPALNTWGSRFVALSFRRNATLVRGKHVDLAFSYGPEVAWNNFMFDNNAYIQMIGNQVNFSQSITKLEKSKLVVPMINIPMMFSLGFKEAKFRMGVGGYIGGRIGGYAVTRMDNERKEKTRNSFGLNDFRYGLTAEIGKRKGMGLFFRYDLSNLFKENQLNGKDLQPWSFGIRI